MSNEHHMDSDQRVDLYLARFNLPANDTHRAHIIDLLKKEIEKANRHQEDTQVISLLCEQLYSIGNLEDVLLIWRAKHCSFDASFSVDIQCLLGAGLAQTKRHLKQLTNPAAHDALEHIEEFEEDELPDWSLEDWFKGRRAYYGLSQ